MTRHTAGWRYPTAKQLQRSAAEAARSMADQQILEPQALLRDIGTHLLRFGCPRCSTVTEIQTADAIRLCGGQATVDDVAARLRHDACDCDLILLLRS